MLRNIVRSLQAACFVNEVAFYPFNFNDDDMAFEGIMFNLKSQGGFVEVLTLELDVRVEDKTDLAIEVYTYNGDFSNVHARPDEWELLADTELVLYPDSSRGAIVPSHAFRPFTLGNGELRSLYVKMKGPWIDNTINVFLDDGEPVPNDNQHVVLYPGAGLTDEFPLSYNKFTRPIFAGGLHLRTEGACLVTPQTRVDYIINTDKEVSDALLVSISEAVDATMESLLRVDSVLVGYQNDYELKQVDKSRSREINFSKVCNWDRCSSIEISVNWSHTDELVVNELLYRMYTFTDMIKEEIGYVLGERSELQYIGKVATKVEFKFLLKDVDLREAVTFDQSQEDYFAKHTTDFINSEVDEKTIQVLSIHVDSKNLIAEWEEEEEGTKEDRGNTEDGNGRRRLQDALGQVELDGRILGTRYSYLTEAEFALEIQDLYYNPGKVREYVQQMAFEVNFPGPISEFGRHKFFENLVAIDGKVEVQFGEKIEATESPTTMAPKEDKEALSDFINRTIDSIADWEAKAWILIGVSILVIFLGVAAFFIVRCVKEEIESKKRKEERQVDKEFMRQEKRLEEIRRKKMMQQQGLDGGSVYSGEFDPNDQSFCNESFAESFMEDSMVFDPQGSANNMGLAAPPHAPPGSRRRFYGPALAQLGVQDMEQPRARPGAPPRSISGEGGPRRMPPVRTMSGHSAHSAYSAQSGYGHPRSGNPRVLPIQR